MKKTLLKILASPIWCVVMAFEWLLGPEITEPLETDSDYTREELLEPKDRSLTTFTRELFAPYF